MRQKRKLVLQVRPKPKRALQVVPSKAKLRPNCGPKSELYGELRRGNPMALLKALQRYRKQQEAMAS